MQMLELNVCLKWIRLVEKAPGVYVMNCTLQYLTLTDFSPLSVLFLLFFLGMRVWDVVSELVCLCTVPSPSNPFALDMRYIKNLPLPDRFLVTGALLNFLEMYVVYGNRDEMHYDKGLVQNFTKTLVFLLF